MNLNEDDKIAKAILNHVEVREETGKVSFTDILDYFREEYGSDDLRRVLWHLLAREILFINYDNEIKSTTWK